jgi:serine/threonine-protein kinase RsbW
MSQENWCWTTEKEIPSEAAAGKRVLEEILAQLKERQWVEHDIFGIHLALEEAIVNAIKHGNGDDTSKRVRVACKLSTERFRIEIADEGPGFDPNAVPDPTDEDHLEIPSGRGIMLMRSFMSHVEFNDRGNCVVMEKQRAAS